MSYDLNTAAVVSVRLVAALAHSATRDNVTQFMSVLHPAEEAIRQLFPDVSVEDWEAAIDATKLEDGSFNNNYSGPALDVETTAKVAFLFNDILFSKIGFSYSFEEVFAVQAFLNKYTGSHDWVNRYNELAKEKYLPMQGSAPSSVTLQ